MCPTTDWFHVQEAFVAKEKPQLYFIFLSYTLKSDETPSDIITATDQIGRKFVFE